MRVRARVRARRRARTIEEEAREAGRRNQLELLDELEHGLRYHAILLQVDAILHLRRDGRDDAAGGWGRGRGVSARGACDARAGMARASQAHRGWLWPVFATPMPV